MSVVMEDHSSPQVTAGGPHVRITLRELRETSFRALVAAGAHAGEAAFAAEQVVHAELHHGSGLRGLVGDLRPAWPRTGLSWRSAQAGAWPVRIVDGARRRSPLRCGALLVDLAAAAPPRHLVVLEGVRDPDRLLDHALLASAAANGVDLLLLPGSAGHAHVQIATGAGELVKLEPGALTDLVPDAPVVRGLAVLRLEPPLDASRAPRTSFSSSSTSEDRAVRRRRAADHGLQVDEDQWQVAYRASRDYLVPDA